MRALHPHRVTIEAAERVLDAEHEFLVQKIPTPKRLWQEVVMLLVARALQLQRSILDTVTIGYDEEVEPSARAMASAVVTLTAIGHGRRHAERDGKALRYLTFGKRARKRALKYNAQSRWLSREQRLAYDAENEAEENALLARAAKDRVVPVCMGPRKKDFWSGYNDRELYTEMKAARWYHHFYAPWSETSHAAARALVHVSEQYFDRRSFDIGPHQRSPWFVLFAVSEFGVQLLVQMNRLFRLHRGEEVRKIEADRQRRFHDAAVAEQQGAQAN